VRKSSPEVAAVHPSSCMSETVQRQSLKGDFQNSPY